MPVVSNQFDSASARPSYSTVSGSCRELGGDPGAARVPLARPAGEHLAAVDPVEPVVADEEPGGHPVLVPHARRAGGSTATSASPFGPSVMTGSFTAVLAGRRRGRRAARPRAAPRASRRSGCRPTSAWSRASRRRGTAASRCRGPAPAPVARTTRCRTPRGCTSATGSKSTPSWDRATTTLTPRPSVSGRRTR